MVIPAGSTFIFQVHYTPKGKAMKDRVKVGLYFNNKPVENEVRTIGIQNGQFKLAAGEANQRVDSTVTFTEDAEVWSLGPHMHLRGTSFEFTLVKPDGSRKSHCYRFRSTTSTGKMVYTLARRRCMWRRDQPHRLRGFLRQLEGQQSSIRTPTKDVTLGAIRRGKK